MRAEVAALQVVQGDKPKKRDGHRPAHQTPRAKCPQAEDALGYQPDHEPQCGDDSGVEGDPEPGREARAGEQRDADEQNGDPAGQPQQWVGKPEDRPLPRLEVSAALHQQAEVASEIGVRLENNQHLVGGESESRPEADDPEQGQEHGRGYKPSSVTRGIDPRCREHGDTTRNRDHENRYPKGHRRNTEDQLGCGRCAGIRQPAE